MAYALDKWTKYKFLATSSKIKKALPLTEKMNKNSFWFMLKKFNNVIVKPSTGSGGRGVLQISSFKKWKYRVSFGSSNHILRGKKATYQYIHHKTKGTSHIIQQWIPLAKIDQRPFDIRAMVQRTMKSNWKLTGTLAKVAGAGYFITNVCTQ